MKLFRLESGGQSVWATGSPGLYVKVQFDNGKPFATSEAVQGRIVCPVDPPTIYGIGLNYRRHAAESGAKPPERPIVFLKPVSTLCGTGDDIVLPRALRSDKVDYECELAFVIGRDAKNVRQEDAEDYILGITCANDVSARDWQLEWGGGQWVRGKSFDTFCPVGPCLVTLDEFPDWQNLRISTKVNGETLQDWRTNDFIYDVPTIVEFLSASTTLLAGTLVLTGTPHGVGMARSPQRWLQSGDIVEVELEGVGILRNQVVEETP